MRTAPRTDWTSPEDPLIAAALTVKCGTCKAMPGEHCRSTVPGQVLLRTVHHFRMDKLLKKENDQ